MSSQEAFPVSTGQCKESTALLQDRDIPADPPQNPGRIGARAFNMVWECRRVAMPLSFSVKVGSSSAHPSGRTPLMRVLNSSPSSLYLPQYSSKVCRQHKAGQHLHRQKALLAHR